MKNFTMILDCIQAFLSEDEIKFILNDIGYKDSARKFNVSSLLNHWIASSLDGWKNFSEGEFRSKACFFDNYKNNYQDFIIRIRNNSKFISKKSLQRLNFLDSSVYEDFTTILGSNQNHSKQRHRVIFFKEYNGAEVRVCTNLMDISAKSIAEIYKSRWDIEVFFKWIKQNLNIKRAFGTTPNAVYGQPYSGLIAYLILRIIYNFSYQRVKFFKYSFIDFFRSILLGDLALEWVILIYSFLGTIRKIEPITW